MDTTQLLVTVGSVLGIVLVGAMAVIPSVMEALAARPDPAPGEGTSPHRSHGGHRGRHPRHGLRSAAAAAAGPAPGR